MKFYKKIMTLSFTSLALTAAPAFAETIGTLPVSPTIEISAGAEYTITDVSAPCTVECGAPNRAIDLRTGPIVSFGFKGIKASELMRNGNQPYNLAFLPISMVLDVSADGERGSGFGHVAGFDGDPTRVRRFMGALVEGGINPANGIVTFKGKLAQVEFNREKGIWEWRALDAAVGLQAAYATDGGVVFNIEMNVGGGIGGVHLNGMGGLQQALSMAPVRDNAVTLDPYAVLKASVRSSSFKVEMIAQGTQRLDLTPTAERALYMGKELNMNSRRLVGALDVEYVFGHKGLAQMGNRISLFVNGSADVDSLTLSNMFFNGGETYRSFMLLGGVRAQF